MAIATVTFEAGGATYRARLTTRAGCQLEDELGISFQELGATLGEKVGYNLMAKFFAATLNDGAGVERQVSMDMIDALGGLGAATEQMVRVLEAATPVAEAAPENPRKAAKAAN